LPYFTPEIIKNYRRILKEHSIHDGKIDTFCKLTPHQRANLKLLPQAQMDEVEALVRVLPFAECSCRAFTENAETI
jgi:hypothetical protein